MTKTLPPPRRKAEPTAVPAPTLARVEQVLGLTLGEARSLWAKLTMRQQDVARLMARGLQNRQIAAELGISIKTLDIHRKDTYDKLGCKTSAAVARVVWLAELAGE